MAHVAVLHCASTSEAKPPGPEIVCQNYPKVSICSLGVPSCTLCHLGAPPARNEFGSEIEQVLLVDAKRPLSDEMFASGLPAALSMVEQGDADLDGISNIQELEQGTHPAENNDAMVADCTADLDNPAYSLCQYDNLYAFRKVHLDFCGVSPSWEDVKAFKEMEISEQSTYIHTTLDKCLDSEYWLGRDGQVWQLAHDKIRPIGAVKAGFNAGLAPVADYDHDYALWVYAHIDDHDARELLTAQYYVQYSSEPSQYVPKEEIGDTNDARENMEVSRRAGMLTTKWYLSLNTMYTSLPRTTAAHAFRSFLNLDIAKLEGLYPVENESVDYDARGVDAPECSICHSTLDPLAYVFKNYVGLGPVRGIYDPNRMEGFMYESENITQMPEEGFIFGQPVKDLQEWVEVAANSDAFAASLVMDYWRVLIAREPTGDEAKVYEELWFGLKNKHGYSVERMLHDLVDTEAYGAP